MDISFACESCGQHIVIDEAAAGQLVDCPKCGKRVEVPSESNPLLKSIASLPSPPSPDKKCPYCAETIKAEAKICRFCGYDLVTGQSARKTAESTPSNAASPLPKILAVLLVIAMMVGGFFAYNFWKNLQKVKAEARPLDDRRSVSDRDRQLYIAAAMIGYQGAMEGKTEASVSNEVLRAINNAEAAVNRALTDAKTATDKVNAAAPP